jgi:transposase InsO family protein
VPEEVLTDNGKVFTNRFALKPTEVLFDKICRENGITRRLTTPRSPTTTGKVERFHRTFREEFLVGRLFGSLDQAQRELDAWVEDYNNLLYEAPVHGDQGAGRDDLSLPFRRRPWTKVR